MPLSAWDSVFVGYLSHLSAHPSNYQLPKASCNFCLSYSHPIVVVLGLKTKKSYSMYYFKHTHTHTRTNILVGFQEGNDIRHVKSAVLTRNPDAFTFHSPVRYRYGYSHFTMNREASKIIS